MKSSDISFLPPAQIRYDADKDKIFTVQNVAGRYKYWYQEQERQTDLDLNWDSFKYRNYDYAIGRFMSMDPLSEKFPFQSPYVFSANRVVDGREYEGLEVVAVGKSTTHSLIISGQAEGGFVMGRDGIYAYGSYGYGVETDISVSEHVTFTYFPNMPTVKNFFEGSSYSGSVNYSPKVIPVSAGLDVIYSNGYWGIKFSLGFTKGLNPLPSVGGYKSNTHIERMVSWDKGATELLKKASNQIGDKIEENNMEINSLNGMIENIKSENNTYSFMLNNLDLSETERNELQTKISNNKATIQNLNGQIDQLNTVNSQLKEAKNLIDDSLNQIHE